jgi:serine/threonine protein kinase
VAQFADFGEPTGDMTPERLRMANEIFSQVWSDVFSKIPSDSQDAVMPVLEYSRGRFQDAFFSSKLTENLESPPNEANARKELTEKVESWGNLVATKLQQSPTLDLWKTYEDNAKSRFEQSVLELPYLSDFGEYASSSEDAAVATGLPMGDYFDREWTRMVDDLYRTRLTNAKPELIEYIEAVLNFYYTQLRDPFLRATDAGKAVNIQKENLKIIRDVVGNLLNGVDGTLWVIEDPVAEVRPSEALEAAPVAEVHHHYPAINDVAAWQKFDQAGTVTSEITSSRTGIIKLVQGKNGWRFAVKYYELEDHNSAEWDIIARDILPCRWPCVLPIVRIEAPSASRGPVLWFEYYPGGALDAKIGTCKNDYSLWSATDRVKVIVSMWLALTELHKSGMTHGSLKPSTVILAEDGLGLLSNWATSLFEEHSVTYGTLVRPPQYTSPHLYVCKDPTLWQKQAWDVFAAAVITYEIITGQPLFNPDLSAAEIRRKTEAGLGIPARAFHPDFYRLLNRCVDPNPGKIPSAGEVLDLIKRILNYQIIQGQDVDGAALDSAFAGLYNDKPNPKTNLRPTMEALSSYLE